MVKSAWASIGYFLHLDPDIGKIARRLELEKKQSAVFNQICLYIYIYIYIYISDVSIH